MSIVRLLTNGKNKELTDKLKADFPISNFTLTGSIKCEPQTENYSLVGTAFDFMLQVYVERINKGRVIRREEWGCTKHFKVAISRLQRSDLGDIAVKLNDNYKKSIVAYHKYLMDGKLTISLTTACLCMANIIHAVRQSNVNGSILSLDMKDFSDLENLIKSCDISQFKAKKICYINPIVGGTDYGGGEADYIIDGRVIDIKCTKFLKIERRDFNQLICYSSLAICGGVNRNKINFPIESINIFYARYDKTYEMPVNDLGGIAKLKLFGKFLADYSKKRTYNNY